MNFATHVIDSTQDPVVALTVQQIIAAAGTPTGSAIVSAIDTELGSATWQTGGGSGAWGGITGTLADQTDLSNALGGKADSSHSHAIGDVDAEGLQDAIAAMLQAGSHTNLTVTYDDAAGTISLAASGSGGGLDQEQAEDIVGSLVAVTGGGINVAYDDAAGTLTFSLTGESYTTAEKNKLAAIEANATADQTAAEIATAYGSVVGQVSAAEITAGTGVSLRTYTPADIVAIVDEHGGGGGGTQTGVEIITAINAEIGNTWQAGAPTTFLGMENRYCPTLDAAGRDSTTLTDLAGSDNGTLTSMDASTDWFEDVTGFYSLDFDGSNDHVVIASDTLEGATAFTVAFHLRLSTVNQQQEVVYQNNGSDSGWGMRFWSDNNVYVYAEDGSSAYRGWDTSGLSDDTWYHLAVVFNGAESTVSDRLKLYVNGTLQVSGTGGGTLPTAMPASLPAMQIGRGEDDLYMDGKVDDVVVFSTVKTAEDITALSAVRGLAVPAVVAGGDSTPGRIQGDGAWAGTGTTAQGNLNQVSFGSGTAPTDIGAMTGSVRIDASAGSVALDGNLTAVNVTTSGNVSIGASGNILMNGKVYSSASLALEMSYGSGAKSGIYGSNAVVGLAMAGTARHQWNNMDYGCSGYIGIGSFSATAAPVKLKNSAGVLSVQNAANARTGIKASTLNLSAVPTSDPLVSGDLWNDSGTLKISAG